jgi:1,5-anhydro-D-fructose reductase (1,5-anhydro-D-mannitol-forming)
MSGEIQKSKNIRWGIIGCGDVTEVKSGPAYMKTDGFEVVAVMRRDEFKCIDYAKRHGIKKWYTDADSLINDPEVDAVYIATPPDTHKYYGLKVADAGKPCCIEKPMAANYEECIAITTAFQNKNIPLFIAYYRRSLPRFVQIKKWLEENKIGDIRHISWNLSKPASNKDLSGNYNWRTDSKIAKGGYFDDLASHGIDLFVYFFGKIKDVSGFSTNQQGLYSATDATTACWIHESGITGTGSWNFGSNLHEEYVTIIGSSGKIEFAVFDEQPIRLTNQEGVTELFIEHPENVQLQHVENMLKHLQGAIKHPSDGTSAMHTSWVMDKILGTV